MALFKVRYKGLSSIREMSAEDLAAVGVGVSGDLRWVGLRPVVIRDPSEQLLELFTLEGTFTVTEIDESGAEGQVIITGKRLDDTGGAVIDGNTGEISVKGE